MRGHTLVWHNQLPGWLTSGTWTPAELRAILKQHIFTEVGHFRGQIWAWDVVNEAIDDNGELRDDIWSRALGESYIADAFRWAHQADPKAILFYNDYNIESSPKSDAVYGLVIGCAPRACRSGRGLQGHLSTDYPFPNDMLQNMRRFAALGLDTAVTEADVRQHAADHTGQGERPGAGLQPDAPELPARPQLHLVHALGLHGQVQLGAVHVPRPG